MKHIIGLTGPSGGGKSTVAKYMEGKGCHVLDTDAITKQLQQPGMPGALAIADAFGSEYFDEAGNLLRSKLAGLVFGDPAQLKKLNAVMHPLIGDVLGQMLQKLDGVCIIDAPVLFEAGAERFCDSTMLVTADRDERMRRIMARDGIGREQAEQRMDAQRKEYPPCDITVDTTHGMDCVEPVLDELLITIGKEKLVKAD